MRFPRKKREPLRNPIVWNKAKYRWTHRHVPWLLCLFQHENGEVAYRRTRPPGWVLMQMAMRQLTVKWWERKGAV